MLDVVRQNITDAFTHYYNELPHNPLNAAASSYLISFGIVTLLSGGNVGAGLLGGAIAATASLIDSALRPIIKQIFSDSTNYLSTVFRRLPVIAIVSVLASSVAPAVLGVNMSISIINSFALTCIFAYLFPQTNPYLASEYVFIGVPQPVSV